MSLYHKAVGYSFEAFKILLGRDAKGRSKPLVVPYIEHIPPDAGAAALWLKNRKPKEWRDKNFEVPPDENAKVNETIKQMATMSENEIARRILLTLETAARRVQAKKQAAMDAQNGGQSTGEAECPT
jgi:hypothetical protein